MESLEVSMLDPLPQLPQVPALARLLERLWEREDVVALWLGGVGTVTLISFLLRLWIAPK